MLYGFYKKTMECANFWDNIVRFDDELAYLISDNLLSLDETLDVYKKIGYQRSAYFIKHKLYPRNAGAVLLEHEILKNK